MPRLNWPTVALIGVIGAIVVFMGWLTDWGPGEILGLVGILGGMGGGAAVAGGVVGRVEQLRDDTTQQTETLADHSRTLETVARRLNGELDGRIADAVGAGSERVLQVLREQGVIR